MSFFLDGIREAWHLITHVDPYLKHTFIVTIEVATFPTVVAALIGLPLGVALGVGRFRGRGFALALANTGLSLPPVLVGLVLSLLFFPRSLLGRFHLIFTLEGVFVAQAVLVFPLITALTASAVRALPQGLLDQARAFGAGRIQVATLALREARVGVFAALIAAVGTGLSEVAAIVLVGGNIEYETQTLASAALEQIDSGHFAEGVAIGILLFARILIVSAVLTFLQYRGSRIPRVPTRS